VPGAHDHDHHWHREHLLALRGGVKKQTKISVCPHQ
jgi:hypothetical protein